MVRVAPGLLCDLGVVTRAEYARFVIATSHEPPSDWNGRIPAAGTEDEPVTHVTLDDARTYALWAAKRLPTDDEWSRAVEALGGERLGVGKVWECTTSAFRGVGWIVRGGRWRDRLAEPPTPANRLFENIAAGDVGFRCFANG